MSTLRLLSANEYVKFWFWAKVYL